MRWRQCFGRTHEDTESRPGKRFELQQLLKGRAPNLGRERRSADRLSARSSRAARIGPISGTNRNAPPESPEPATPIETSECLEEQSKWADRGRHSSALLFSGCSLFKRSLLEPSRDRGQLFEQRSIAFAAELFDGALNQRPNVFFSDFDELLSTFGQRNVFATLIGR